MRQSGELLLQLVHGSRGNVTFYDAERTGGSPITSPTRMRDNFQALPI